MKNLNLLSLAFILIIGFQSCKSGKKAFQKGNYYLAVIQSCDKLRRSPNNKKARKALADAYPLAIQTIELNNKNLKSSNSMTKWKTIVRNYKNINHMYEEILRSPAALGIIPNPVDRYAELEIASKNAAEESYVFGVDNLNRNNRKDAIIAYNAFLECQSYVPNYKDTNKLLDEAKRIATILVLVNQDPVPANFAVSGVYFKNKIDEYLHSTEARKNFIEYYRPDEVARLGIKPDHELTLRYQNFSIGNVYQKEHVEHITRDSVVVGTVAGTTGTGSGSTGNSRNTDTRDTSGDDGSASASDTFDKGGTKDDSGNLGDSGATGGDGNSGGNTKDNTGNSGNSDGTGNDDNDNKSGNSGDSKNDNPSGSKTKVKVCHNGQTLSISRSALQAHLDHGDSSGSCSSDNDDDKNNKDNGEKKDEPEDDDDDKKGGNSNTGNTGTSGNLDKTGNSSSDKDKKSGGDDKGNNNSGNSKGGGAGGGGSDFYSGDSKNNSNTNNARAGEDGRTISGNIPDGHIPVYGTVKATLTIFEKTVSSKALLSMTLTEIKSGRVLKQDLFPTEYIWESRWGTFNGDEGALSDEQLELCQQKEQQAPDRDETFNLLSEELYSQVIKNIKRFYNNY